MTTVTAHPDGETFACEACGLSFGTRWETSSRSEGMDHLLAHAMAGDDVPQRTIQTLAMAMAFDGDAVHDRARLGAWRARHLLALASVRQVPGPDDVALTLEIERMAIEFEKELERLRRLEITIAEALAWAQKARRPPRDFTTEEGAPPTEGLERGE